MLQRVAKAAGVRFSYNSSALPTDSLVRLSVEDLAVGAVLHELLGAPYQFVETAGYIIIRHKTIKKRYTLSGRITNRQNGAPLSGVSVFERGQYLSTLTDSAGRFALRLRATNQPVALYIRKFYFNDTILLRPSGWDQSLAISLTPIRSIALQPVTVRPDAFLGQSWINRLLSSSRWTIRDLNLQDFFVRQPFQYGLWPGLGTHGTLGPQISNRFSFNILGGYAGGVNGVELAGLFNMDQRAVQYVQIAGLFNSVGGQVTGFQTAGLYNSLQAGISGTQIAGLANQVAGELRGAQLAGIVNRTQAAEGLQIAGITNRNNTTLRGVQIAGILNRTSWNRGLQLGLVNLADSATGYAIGLLNLTKKGGYRRLSIGWREGNELNVALKTGREKLYSLLQASWYPGKGPALFAAGFGLGREDHLSTALHLTTALTEQTLFTGPAGDLPLIVRLQTALSLQCTKHVALFAGPAFSLYFPASDGAHNRFTPPAGAFSLWGNKKGWAGLQLGLTFF